MTYTVSYAGPDLAPGERGTYGHFLEMMKARYAAAKNAAQDLDIEHCHIAALLHVSRDTIVDWCAKSYDAGRIMPMVRIVTDPATGQRRRVANHYVVALSAKCRRTFQEQWQAAKLAAGVGASVTQIALAARRVAARAIDLKRRLADLLRSPPPYVENSPQQNGEPSPISVYAPEKPRDPRVIWRCLRDGTGNAWPVPWCRTCRADKPFTAERIIECPSST